MSRSLRYFSEGIISVCVFRILSWLPYATSSAIGGGLLRRIGPVLGRSRIARKNLRNALPELDAASIDRIIADMWDNLGRVCGEFPHLGRMTSEQFDQCVIVEGAEYIEQAKQCGLTCIFFSGHLANWELAPKTLAMHGTPLALVYRRGNNPWLDRLIQETRGHYQSEGVAKGAGGSKQLLRAIQQGRHIGMLLDQKMNTGIPADFFGRKAMTATAIATLALKYGCPIIPVRVVRNAGTRHKVTIFPPLTLERSGDEAADINQIMSQINQTLEGWIREYPAQWIWIHRRWPTAGRAE
ncbi:MAG TPA: lauroyl acyltransferase [Gammaproteobacteria bacterium]|nr:lauroyl acyltransferase [Gammaproteobacteria bacterium]